MTKFIALAALVAISGTAHAQLSVSGGSFIDSIQNYSAPPVETPSFTSGLLNGLIDAGAGGRLTVTFLGKEAGHLNLFTVSGDGSTLELLNSATIGTTKSVKIGGGTLGFRFLDTTDGTAVGNGGNGAAPAGSYAVFGTGAVKFAPATAAHGKTFDLIVGFNDGYIADADYDDHVVGLSLSPIPEPGTYALMAAGLAAVGFVARRRRVEA